MKPEYVKLAISNLQKRKLRTWLTMIGIFISVATIFVLISLSIGLQNAVQEQFRLLGTDKFFVQASGQLGPPGTQTAAELTSRDLEAIEKVQGVKRTSYLIIGNAKIEFNKQTRFFTVIGNDIDGFELYLESGSLKIIEGRSFKRGDSKDILVGYNYMFGNIFSKPVKVGDTLLINGVEYKIRGVMDKVGNSQDDRQIYMPIDEARSLFNITTRIDSITIQIDSGEQVKDVAERVEKKLRNTRDVTEKTQDFTILTPEELLASFDSILQIITGFLVAVAIISLVVGGIGIANTVYTSVLERTKEIGVMKAVGARNRDILEIFLIEAGTLGLVGGIIGVLIGIGISKSLEYIAVNQLGTNLLQAAIPIWLIIACLAFAFLSGAIFGVWPAYRASKIRPVQALRYE
jgi:putative ABC transport system permease protein